MSSNFKYTHGLGHVPSFQTSCRPFLSSSITVPDETSEPLEISFDSVTRFVIITNTTDPNTSSRPIRFGFSSNGIKGTENNNYIVLDNAETFEAEFKITKVYFLSNGAYEGEVSIVAGLTGISSNHLENNWSGSSGVG